jgi:hypothetical protein
MFHAIVLEQLEFCFIALATWHIPLSSVSVEVTSSAYASSYSASARRRLAGSSSFGSGDILTFTPVDQLRRNVDGCAFGFSFFLGLNTLLYVARWSEILFDPEASTGAKALARFTTLAYTAVAGVFFAAAALCFVVGLGDGADDDYTYEDERASACMVIWFGANSTILGCLAFWVWVMRTKPVEEAQAQSVPMCVSYLIVRVGEWTMVMLGETVLSLLGVPLKRDIMVYLMFACSMLMACNLQFQGFTIHPIHAKDHVLQGGQFSFKGYLYLIWATIWYALILVVIGTGAKVLTKKAVYGIVLEGANWCLCGGLAAAFVSIMTFQSLHHRNESKGLGILDCFTSNQALITDRGAGSSCTGTDEISFRTAVFDLCKVLTVVLLFALALADQTPNYTVFGCYFVVFMQSILVLYENSSGLDDHDDQDHDDEDKKEDLSEKMKRTSVDTTKLFAKLRASVLLGAPKAKKKSEALALVRRSTSSTELNLADARGSGGRGKVTITGDDVSDVIGAKRTTFADEAEAKSNDFRSKGEFMSNDSLSKHLGTQI